MRRLTRTAASLLTAVTVAALASPAGALADGEVLRNGSELRYDSDSQDAENLVISRQTAGFECGAAGTPCLQFANGPQAVRDEADGCAQVTATVVACSPAGVTRIFLKLDDGDDFAKVLGSVPPATMDGSFDDDFLDSREGKDTMRGGPGDDELFDDDSSADDVLDGGDGDDTLSLSGGDDDVLGGPGVDTAELGGDDDTVRLDDLPNDGGPGEAKNVHADVEVVDGGSDNLFGNDGANTFLGGSSNDILDGGGGRDVLDGGEGADELIGGADVDSVVYGADEAQTITLDDVRDDGAAGELDNVRADVETVDAGPGDDAVTGNGCGETGPSFPCAGTCAAPA